MFWQLYGGVNGSFLQEGLCHTQVCCTQSPCPCGSPLLTHTSSGDTQTQFWLSLCGFPGSWCAQGIFEPSEHVWQVWGLILNAISPLLPSCLGFSFALGCGISPHSCSSPGQQLLQCLPSCRGFSVHGHGVSPHSCYSTTQLYNVCFMIPIDSHAQAQEGWNKPFVLREAGKQIQAGSSISTDTLPSANYQHWGNKI